MDPCPTNVTITRRLFPHAAICQGSVWNVEDVAQIPEHEDLITCAMQCQPSSTQNKRRKLTDERHDTGLQIVDAAVSKQPLVICIENVSNFRNITPRMTAVLNTLRDAGYSVDWYTFDSAKWGLASRRRLIILGSLIGADLLRPLYNRMLALPRLTIAEGRPAHRYPSIWHPVRPDGHGPNGQACVIPDTSVYPTIDTKCLQPPPRNYRRHPADHKDGVKNTHLPDARDVLSLLGFPRDYLTQNEINAVRCTCPSTCNGHRSSQVERMLGRAWSPPMAEAIGRELAPHIRRYHEHDDLGLRHVRTAHHDDWREHLKVLDKHDHCRVNLGRTQLEEYIKQVETRTERSFDDEDAVKYYSLDDVKIHADATPKSEARAKRMLRTYEEIFSKNSMELPRKVVDKNGKPVKIRFRFKPDYKPSKCPPPKDRPGSAKWRILEKFCKAYLKMGLVKAKYDSKSVNRPHLVAKYAEHAARDGIPDDLRLTGDMARTNDGIELVPATRGDVAHEIDFATGHACYWSADCSKAYWSYDLDEDSSEACALWLPHEGHWRIFAFTRMQMGSKNAGTHMQAGYFDFADGAYGGPEHTNLADDNLGWGNPYRSLPDGTPGEIPSDPAEALQLQQDNALDRFEDFLKMCAKHHITIKPSKVNLLMPCVEFYGWRLDKDGRTLAKRHLEPIRKMVPPKNIGEVRTLMGLLNQYQRFLTDERTDANGRTYTAGYKEIVKPMTYKHMNDPANGKTFADRWGDAQQRAFDCIRDKLLAGVHLSVPLSDRPYFMSTDMSEFGWSACLYQLGDDGEKRYNQNFNEIWNKTMLRAPAVCKEGQAWCHGFELCMPYIRTHGHIFYTITDSLPVGWQRKGSGRQAMSRFKLAQFDDVEWRVLYVQGPRNVESDAYSRPPMLGELLPTVAGILTMLDRAIALFTGLDRMTLSKTLIHSYTDKQHVADWFRKWRGGHRGSVTTGGISHIVPEQRNAAQRAKPMPEYDLVIAMPDPPYGPSVAHALLKTGRPFICIVDTTLIPEIHRRHDGKYDKAVRALLEKTSRAIFSGESFTAIVGGAPHADLHRMYHYRNSDAVRMRPREQTDYDLYLKHIRGPATPARPRRPARARGSLARVYAAAELTMELPGLSENVRFPTGDISSWIPAQQDELDSLPAKDKKHVQPRPDGVLMYAKDETFGRCFVPKAQRKGLTILAHEHLQHLDFSKTHTYLRQWYWWPLMRTCVKATVRACKDCRFTRSKRNFSHGQWHMNLRRICRSAYGYDLKGVYPADTGENEISVCIDLTSRELTLFSTEGRDAETIAWGLLDHVINRHGVPLEFRTDAAPELVSKVMAAFWRPYGTNATTTRAYHPTGNSIAERVMDYLNRCLMQLSDEQYRRWPRYLSSFEAAWNGHVCTTIGATPFEISHGAEMLSPTAAIAAHGMLDPNTHPMPATDELLQQVQDSAAAWTKLAKATTAWHRKRELAKLNAHGTHSAFAKGDKAMVFVPPTAAEAKRRKRKVKHISWYRGPCTVVQADGTNYTLRHDITGKHYERTICNLAPCPSNLRETTRPTDVPPPEQRRGPTLDRAPTSTDCYKLGDFIIAKDAPHIDIWWLLRVTKITDDGITCRIYATRSADARKAVWKPIWSTKNNRLLDAPPRPPVKAKEWTQEMLTQQLPDLVLMRYLKLTKKGQFTADTFKTLSRLRGSTVHAPLKRDMRDVLGA